MAFSYNVFVELVSLFYVNVMITEIYYYNKTLKVLHLLYW